MKKLSPEELREKKEREAKKKEFERKIEEDRLGISRKKQKRVMRFMTYRIIKLSLLLATGICLLIYTPAVLPLTVIIALMLLTTKKLQKEKNKNVNKKYRIKIRAADSIIAILMIVLTIGMTGYSLVTAYMNGGSLNDSSTMSEKLSDSGFSQAQISAAITRMNNDQNAYERIAEDALTLMTGKRNVFRSRRIRFKVGGTGRPPMDFDGGEMPSMPTFKRPNVFQMMRNMPLEMVFRQIFNMVCAVMVGIMVIIGTINVIESFKYGEIKKVALGKKFDAPTGPNDPCLCGSGKKIKNCDCGQWWREKG